MKLKHLKHFWTNVFDCFLSAFFPPLILLPEAGGVRLGFKPKKKNVSLSNELPILSKDERLYLKER